jgi:hypothetical protein
VIFELVKLRAFRDNLWLQVKGFRALRKVGEGAIIKEENAACVGWDDHEVYSHASATTPGRKSKSKSAVAFRAM